MVNSSLVSDHLFTKITIVLEENTRVIFQCESLEVIKKKQHSLLQLCLPFVSVVWE